MVHYQGSKLYVTIKATYVRKERKLKTLITIGLRSLDINNF